MLSNQKIKELQLWLSDKIHYYEEKANKADRLTTGLINNSIKVSFEEVQNKLNELLLEPETIDKMKEELYPLIPLEKELADKFINNTFEYSSHDFVSLRSDLESYKFHEVLHGAFSFLCAPEGHDFWYNLYLSLKEKDI